MKIHNNYIGMKNEYPGLVVALGNFDGVHQGHRRLLNRLVETAAQLNATPAVFTFDPHPMQVIKPERSPLLLMNKQDKLDMIASLGVEVLFCHPFTREFAQMSPESFVRDVLVNELGIKGLLVGFNYSFGKGGHGNPELLAKFANEYNFYLEIIPPVIMAGHQVSSTMIRGLLLEGRVDEASNFLGYKPFIRGTVVTGEKRGRQIGFPTANMDIPQGILIPDTGVYAVRVKCNEKNFMGVANIGFKPTFHPDRPQKNIEVHIIDFAEDIYDQTILIEFTRRIRPEIKFDSVHHLVRQINNDKNQAIKYLTQE